MSALRVRMLGSVVPAWAIIDICTAWAWWVLMSRRKPASGLVSPGTPAVRVARKVPPAPRRRPAMSSAASQATPKRKSRGGAGTAVSAAPGDVVTLMSAVLRCGAHRGDAVGAGRSGLDRGVLPERLDELVDPRVVDRVDLELVAPRLQGHILVEVGDRAHQGVGLALDLALQLGDLVGRQALLVRQPD